MTAVNGHVAQGGGIDCQRAMVLLTSASMLDHVANPGERPAVRLSRMQLGSVVAVLVGYAMLSHYGSSENAPKGLNVALSFGPIFLIVAVMMWRWTRPWFALLIAATMGTLVYHYWAFLGTHYEVADLIEQCSVYTLIGFGFAHSMISARGPVFVRIAADMHGALTSREAAYARVATMAWAVFYLLIATAIAVLYFSATRDIWSVFVNFVIFGLIGAACFVDYRLRRWLLPRRPGDGLFAMLQRALIG